MAPDDKQTTMAADDTAGEALAHPADGAAVVSGQQAPPPEAEPRVVAEPQARAEAVAEPPLPVAEPPAETQPEAPVEAKPEAPVEAQAEAPVEAQAEAPVEAPGEPADEAQPAGADDAADEGDEGDEGEDGDEGDEASDGADDSPEISVEAGAEPGQKKRRRRRRKRKPGAEGAAAGPASNDGAGEADARRSTGSDRAREESRGDKHERERPAFSPGDQVFGKVAKVTDQAMAIDIAGKATGLFDLSQLAGEPPKEGDQFIAKVQSCSTRGGMVMLVAELAKGADARAAIREALEGGKPIDGWVTGVIKGGVEVDIQGVRAFAPASHVELRPNADLSYLLGRKLPFMVSHYAKKGRDIVVSRKAMLEQEADKERGEILAKIQPETVCQGVVRKVLSWGAFVSLPDFGGVEGVVHMSEASHDRGAKLSDVLKAGEQITVKILRLDDKGKLWLSRKAVEKNPWDDVAQHYPVGSRHQGTIVRLADFGAFIQLEPGVDGLCHISDLSFNPIEHPSEAVKIGDVLPVVVAHLDSGGHKIGLHPAPPAEEASEPRPKLQASQTVQAVVMQVKDGGLAVRIVGLTGRAARAFIPAGHTGTPRGTELRKVFPVGKRLEAKVLEVDPRKGESKLSIRAVSEDAERQAYREYRKQVQRESSFGTLADLLKKS